jgi:hypothetical protein
MEVIRKHACSASDFFDAWTAPTTKNLQMSSIALDGLLASFLFHFDVRRLSEYGYPESPRRLDLLRFHTVGISNDLAL